MSASAVKFSKLSGPKDLPRFMKEINGQVQENFSEVAHIWMMVTNNIREGRDYDHGLPVPPADPGVRPVLVIPPGMAVATARDMRDDYKFDLGTWSYNKDKYDKHNSLSVGLFGFIMNHLETLPANRVRRHMDFAEAERDSNFGRLWFIVITSHQSTGAAKLAEDLKVKNDLLGVTILKDESLEDYCHRFDELLTQMILARLGNDGPEVATAFMKGLVNSKFKMLAMECLSATIPLVDSVQAMQKARNYDALFEVENETEISASVTRVNKKMGNRNKSSSYQNSKVKDNNDKHISDDERFKIGREKYLAKKNMQNLKKKKPKNVRCYECGAVGHFAKDCKKYMKPRKNETASTATSDEPSDEDSDNDGNDDDDDNDEHAIKRT